MTSLATDLTGPIVPITKSNGTQAPRTSRAWLAGMIAVAQAEGKLITVQTVLTPELAEALLERNTSNRPLSRRTISLIKGAIERGEWRETHQAIGVCADGSLSDGQHRCHAVLQSGESVPTLITFGLSPEAFAVIDTHKARNGADTLALSGASHVVPLTMVVRNSLIVLFIYETGKRSALARYNISNAAILDAYRADPERYDRATQRWISTRSQFRLVGAGFASLLYMLDRSGVASPKIEEFCALVGSGLGMDASNPVHVFRQHFVNRSGRFSTEYQFAMAVKVWNAWISGRTVGLLKFGKKEDLPKIRMP